MLTKQDLARRWQVCERTVRRLVRRFAIPARQFNVRTVRFQLSDVLRLESKVKYWLHLTRAAQETRGLSKTVHERELNNLAQWARERRAKASREQRATHRNRYTHARAVNGSQPLRPAAASGNHRPTGTRHRAERQP